MDALGLDVPHLDQAIAASRRQVMPGERTGGVESDPVRLRAQRRLRRVRVLLREGIYGGSASPSVQERHLLRSCCISREDVRGRTTGPALQTGLPSAGTRVSARSPFPPPLSSFTASCHASDGSNPRPPPVHPRALRPGMQPRPPPAHARYHPPVPPHIPLRAIHSLVPRLTATINDIDAFKALLASGNADGSLPNWSVPSSCPHH